jgi:hypothetical protein
MYSILRLIFPFDKGRLQHLRSDQNNLAHLYKNAQETDN